MNIVCPSCDATLTLKALKPGQFKPKCPKCGRPFLLEVPEDDNEDITVTEIKLKPLPKTKPVPVLRKSDLPPTHQDDDDEEEREAEEIDETAEAAESDGSDSIADFDNPDDPDLPKTNPLPTQKQLPKTARYPTMRRPHPPEPESEHD